MSNRIKIIILLTVIVLLISLATVGYMVIMNISLIDALYMTVITISTVGYTEVAEMSDQAKLFSIAVITISVGTIGYIFSNIFRFFSEGLVKEAWRVKRMQKDIELLENHFIICGAGETGYHIIKEFKNNRVPFVVIDNDELTIQELITDNVLYIKDDATHEDALEKANISKAKGLIATLSKDADNVFVVLTAREMNKNLHIVARAHEENSYKKLKRAGADNTVSPNEIGGKKMAAMMLKPSISLFMDSIIDTGKISIEIEEVRINQTSDICNKTLQSAKISEKTGLIVLAIRKNDEFLFNPKADEILKPGDYMIVVGEKEQIVNLRKLAALE
ncbi:potassium channel family protein [Liberiplasma polymorphum]|jgi:voltage-gated potassium channel|uniref:potassium channel family protein n=1 Tax=Liberiplasma polymorphum TaxID=3374570 RepID=UPI003770DDEF